MAISYVEVFDNDDDEEIDIDDIDECTCEQTLSRWYTELEDLYDRIRCQVDERRFVGTAEDGWLDAAGGKLAFLRIGRKKVENRMLRLGYMVPYLPTDPRSRVIRNLEEKLKRMKKLLKDAGIEVVELAA